MTGLFGLGAVGTVVLLGAVVLLIAAVASPPGRRATAAGFGAVGRWPALIRSELRGAAPLQRDPSEDADNGADTADGAEGAGGAGAADDATSRTRPDIPPVTRGLPVVDRPDRR